MTEHTHSNSTTDAREMGEASDGNPGKVRQLRVVVRVDDYDAAVAFYRDALGLPEQAAFHGPDGARVTIFDAGHATLEIANAEQVAMIDNIEVGRGVSPHFRIAFEVDDVARHTERLAAAGATVIAMPTETPWRSRNSRLDAPGDLQLTLFEELAPVGSDPASAVALLPLDAEILRRRLETDDFQLDRELVGSMRSLHFGPQFPGDAIVMYRRLLATVGDNDAVEGTYVVVDLATNDVVGQVGTMGPPGDGDVEIGYGINPTAQRRGIATQAVRQLVAILSEHGSVGVILAHTASDNPSSARVLEKAGFARTGRVDSEEGELQKWELQRGVSD